MMTISIENLLSAETLEKFKVYEDILTRWNQRTTLVQKETLLEFKTRHILDSLQLIPLIENRGSTPVSFPEFDSQSPLALPNIMPPSASWHNLDSPSLSKSSLFIVDIGSGAGFPGMVLAMCGFKNVHLCESNTKKCFFLEEVARQTHTHVKIINERIEKISEKFDVVVSRACTELNGLLGMMQQLTSSPSSYALFPKGRSWQEELMAAQKNWIISGTLMKSVTSRDSVVLCLSPPIKRRKRD